MTVAGGCAAEVAGLGGLISVAGAGMGRGSAAAGVARVDGPLMNAQPAATETTKNPLHNNPRIDRSKVGPPAQCANGPDRVSAKSTPPVLVNP